MLFSLRAALLAALLVVACCAITPALAAASKGSADSHAVETTDSSAAPAAALYEIEGTVKLPAGAAPLLIGGSKFVGARVLLNGGELSAVVRGDGAFVFRGLQGGRSYTLDVSGTEFEYPTVRVDVSAKKGQAGRLTAIQLPSRSRLSLPLVLRPSARTDYFQKRESVNLWSWLKNPMVIMMLLTIFMAVVMPRMMSSMDPAELAEMQKMQSQFSIAGLQKKLESKAAELKEIK